MIDADYLRSVLRYEPETGDFFWIRGRKGARKNRPAGCISKSHGYRTICVDGNWYGAQRLAWLYMTGEWPPQDIDHINRIKSDNSFLNLRKATRSENSLNVGKKRRNTSGLTGVSWDSNRRKWLAQIRISGRKTNLGRFDTKEAAHAAWLKAAAETMEFRAAE